jgi:hypothetical protein
MTLPTPIELATLAATLTLPSKWWEDDPFYEFPDELTYRARRAFELWEISSQVLATAPASMTAASERESSRRSFYEQFTQADTVPIKAFLQVVMPKSRPHDRVAKWRAFRASALQFQKEGAVAVDAQMLKDRTEGLEWERLHMMGQLFLSFIQREGKAIREKRSRQGAEAKNAKTRAVKNSGVKNQKNN